MASCATCRFFHESLDGNSQCRRRAPQAFVIPVPNARALHGAPQQLNIQFAGTWPPVTADGWCGEYESDAEVVPLPERLTYIANHPSNRKDPQ